MSERACKTCRYGESGESNDEVVAVRCKWGPPGVAFDIHSKRFTKVELNMHPDEWCYRWKRKLIEEGDHEDN